MLYHKVFGHPKSNEWVVFIHGAGGSSSIWFKQLKAFKVFYNVLLIDLRGHGKSKNVFSNKEYSYKEVSKDVIEVLDYLKVPPAHFVGISLGTLIIRNIAELDEQKVKSMILGGAVTRLNLRSQFLVKVADLFKKVVPFMWIYSICAHILMPRKNHKVSRNLFIREAQRLSQSEFLKWFSLTASTNRILKLFNENEIAIPTLYIMGEQDYMFLPQVKNLVKQHQLSSLNIIPNCGHVCNVESPENFNRHSIAFIKAIQ